MITIKEIAEIAGVSTTTVSNVIHGKTKKVSQMDALKLLALYFMKKSNTEIL